MGEEAEAVRGLYGALSRGDAEGARRHVTVDFVLEDVALGRADGPDEAVARWRTLLTAFPDVTFRVEHELSAGDMVLQEQVVEGTHRGPFMDVPPSGAKVRYRTAAVAECRGGRVAALRLYRDVSGFLSQFAILVRTAVVAAVLNRPLPISLIVGTTFTIINQLTKILAGTLATAAAFRLAANYLVPFTVSTVSALTFRQPQPGRTPGGPFGRLLRRRIQRAMREAVEPEAPRG